MQSNEQVLIEYLDWLRNTKGRAGVTVYNYSRILERLLLAVGHTSWGDVPLRELETYVRRPRGRRGRGSVGAPATQAKDAAIVRAFYRYLHARGHVQVNPAILLGAPTVHNQNPRPVPDDDLVRLFGAAESEVEHVWLGLGAFVGLRRREVCELTPTQVFTQGGTLVNFKRKGGGDDVTPYADLCEIVTRWNPGLGASDFVNHLGEYVLQRVGSPRLLEYGEVILPSQRETLVHELPPGMTDPNLLNRRMHSLCARAGAPPYTPHQLRHTFVTNLLRAGVPLHLVSRMANHSSPSITARYVKAGASELREWMSTVNRHA